MKPTGRKKDPYSSFQRRGLLNIPIKQTTLDEVTINANKEAAQNLDTAEEKLMKEYFDESTKENVKLYKKTGKGGDGTGIPYAEAYKIAGEKGYLKPNETLEEYTARAKAESIREERTSDGEPDSNPDIATNQNQQKAGTTSDNIGTTNVDNRKIVGYQENPHYDRANVKSMQEQGILRRLPVYEEVGSTEHSKDGTSDYNTTIGSNETQANIDDVVDEQARIKAENSERISGDETTAVKQLSPTRQLMNKYMPKKSMAKQETVIGDDGKPIKGPIGPEFVVHADRTKGKYGDMVSVDGKKVTKSPRQSDVYFEKSVAKQKKEKKTTNYKFKDGEANVSSESKVNRRFRPDRHKIKA